MRDWNSGEIEELKQAYVENDVPSDRLVKNKEALSTFAAKFNERALPTKAFTADEIADRLFKLRKSGKLPRIRT